MHRLDDVNKMLEEFARYVFVGGVLARQLQRDGQHIETVHAHPTGCVRLLDVAAGWQRCAAVEDADIVETEEATLKNISALSVFAIHPPGEVEQEFLEDAFQKHSVTFAATLFFNFV